MPENKKIEQKKPTVKKDKGPSIMKIVKEGVAKQLKFEAILAQVKKAKPKSKFNRAHYNWYKNN